MHSTKRNGRERKLHRRCELPLLLHQSTFPNHPSTPFSAQSTLTNKSRLRLLHQREENLQDLFAICRSSITTLAEDHGRYIQFLEGVTVQGFLQVLEPSVTVLARKKDVDDVKQAATNAASAYKEISGRDISFEVEGSLSDDG